MRDATCFTSTQGAQCHIYPKKNRKYRRHAQIRLEKGFSRLSIYSNGELDSVAKCLSILERNEHLALPGADGVMLGRAVWKFPALLLELQKAFYPKKNIHSLRDIVENLEYYYNLQKSQGIDTRRVVRGWVNLFNKQKGAKKWRIMLGEGQRLWKLINRFSS